MAKQSVCSCSKVERIWKRVCAKTKGAEFKKVDLHIHTPGSDDATGRNRYNFKFKAYLKKHGKEKTNEKIKEIAGKLVENATNKNIAVIAITDHNSPSYINHHDVGSRTWYSEIRKAVKKLKKNLVVLPGCEISSDDAHILAVFPPEEKPEDFAESAYKIAFVLDACNFKIEDYGILARTGSKSVIETVRLILQRGGLGIPAHIDGGNKAMLKHYDKAGAIYENIVNEPGLNSFEIVQTNIGGKCIKGKIPNARKKNRICKEEIKIYLNSLRLKTKRHPFPKYPFLSFIQNSDSHCLKDIGKRFFYAKMEEPSFRSLQNVLEDPETRVKSMDFKQGYSGKTLIEGMYIEKGSGKCPLRFNENLNIVIGESGSFKSTLLKLLIFGLDRIKEEQEFSYILKEDGGFKTWVFIRKDLRGQPLYCFFRRSGMKKPCLFEKKGSKWKQADLAKVKLALPRLYNKKLADKTFRDNNEFRKFLHKMGISKGKTEIPRRVEQQLTERDRLQQPLFKKEFPLKVTWKGEIPSIKLLKDKKYIEFSRLDSSHKEIAKILTLLFFSKNFGLLVIDEPEIDLDKKDIAYYLVPVLRSLKAKNQVLLTTKNADLVVSADAENVIVMASHKNIKVNESGDFLKENIRQQVIELLEGGEKALLKRSIKIDLNLKEPPFVKY